MSLYVTTSFFLYLTSYVIITFESTTTESITLLDSSNTSDSSSDSITFETIDLVTNNSSIAFKTGVFIGTVLIKLVVVGDATASGRK